MSTYENNNLRSYWRLLSKTTAFGNGTWLSRLLRWFQTAAKLITLVLKDAGIELIFLLIFWYIITVMGQGRDLIVSLFEPDSIYSIDRIYWTILSAISFSVSMWIIPAFLFQQRDRANAGRRFYKSIFKRHLFFIHRVLPLIPFWLLAFVLFNEKYIGFLFIGLSVIQLMLMFLFHEKVKEENRRWYAVAVLILLAAAITWFTLIYKIQYSEAKIALAVIFYLLAFLMHYVYLLVDSRLQREHQRGDHPQVSAFRRYSINSWVYVSLLVLHVFIVLMIFNAHSWFEIAPESMLLYLFSLDIFIIDLVVYFFNVSARRRFVGAVLFVLVVAVYGFSTSFNLNLRHYTLDGIKDTSILNRAQRLTFEDKYNDLKKEIIANTSATPYPIILVSGEGGGSRAGMWFSENLINFDYYTRGSFRKHIFSVSTVSGSSVGASTVYAFWDLTDGGGVDEKWLSLPSKVYNNNFVGSSISGLLLTDLLKLLLPFSTSLTDRNNILQQEEAFYTQRACLEIMKDTGLARKVNIPDSARILNRDFMSFFYTRDSSGLVFKKGRPLAFINTCRSNDGRRGIFSPVKLGNDYFNDAIDIAGYLYEDSVCDYTGTRLCFSIKKTISLGQVCNSSELFPLFSAPAYIDSLGSFVDGGYHENTGLKTTLDIYQKLKEMLQKDSLQGKYKIYIVYLKNGSSEKELYKPLSSEIPIVLPLKAFSSQPFQGSASYFEERARYIDSRDSTALNYIVVKLDNQMVIDNTEPAFADADSIKIEREILNDLSTGMDTSKREATLRFPLARWLSNSVIRRMRMNASLFRPGNEKLMSLLNTVNAVNRNTEPSLDVFRNLKPSAARTPRKRPVAKE
ncbi:ABC-2 transporter permease [Chitinophaga barathri]|uniref:PNPLA domain-containing protein n=1 Tax=Chitinophaga barathri TaxID=1647451 RepID=A0A3N4MGT1_9BACT|nr:ABC-2 transporter permease [Chitinophaga barathri]RPD42798.1 hypothetical protein EG028_00425 [Chitinophaga barathri]